jgi:carbonic anhydrase
MADAIGAFSRYAACRDRSVSLAVSLGTGAGRATKATAGEERDQVVTITALKALERLQEGNHRFATGRSRKSALSNRIRRVELVAGQRPFAIVLGCSDSRVPAEIVFDQGLGDLFVIRVAGNVVAPSQIGSVEFAVERFETRLVVVLGHSQCGAVLATLEELRQPNDKRSRNFRSIVDRIRPSVEGLLLTAAGMDPDALVREAVRANVRMAANHLRHGSEILERLIDNDGLLVVGAEYSLESGRVDIFDGVREDRLTRR